MDEDLFLLMENSKCQKFDNLKCNGPGYYVCKMNQGLEYWSGKKIMLIIVIIMLVMMIMLFIEMIMLLMMAMLLIAMEWNGMSID